MKSWTSRARLAAALLALALAACSPAAPDDRGRPMLVPPPEVATTFTSTSTAGPGRAVDMLAQLPVKGRAPKTGYSRGQFGPAWADVDHNGCDTRDDILKRDLDGETFRPGTHDCVVLSGILLRDPYTGKMLAFTRGRGTSNRVQIDHRVALADAWQKGAQALSAAEREALANDPANLVAVDGPTNEAKGDADAATWLPPVISYRCQYVEAQIMVKAKYHLWVTPAEHDAMAGVLAGGCDE